MLSRQSHQSHQSHQFHQFHQEVAHRLPQSISNRQSHVACSHEQGQGGNESLKRPRCCWLYHSSHLYTYEISMPSEDGYDERNNQCPTNSEETSETNQPNVNKMSVIKTVNVHLTKSSAIVITRLILHVAN